MQLSNGDYIGPKGQPGARLENIARQREERLENLAQAHDQITEPFARMIDHFWALKGRTLRTQLERFGLVADVPIANIRRVFGISRQAIRKQQLLLEAERSENGFPPQGDEKSFSRIVDYEWALTGTRSFTQLLRFYIVTPLPTLLIRRELGVSKQAISRQRKLLRDYRVNAKARAEKETTFFPSAVSPGLICQ